MNIYMRPDGDLENLTIEKCIARDLKILFPYNMFQIW